MVTTLSAGLLAMLARRSGPAPAEVADLVRGVCRVEHVAIVAVRADECTVLAAVGPTLLDAGTTSTPSVSSRLVAVAAGRVWRSPDLRREPGYDRPIDQLALTVGLRSGAGVPLLAAGEPVCAVLLSSTVGGRDWDDAVETVDAAGGLLAAAIGLGRAVGEPLRIVVVHRDPLLAQGLARIVERGLPAEVEVAGGEWDQRLPELLAGADAVVADSALGLGADRTVAVYDDIEPADGIAVDRRSAPTTLVKAVAEAAGGIRARRPRPTTPALSPREYELLRALAGGLPYKAIGARLGLSPATVRSYSRGLYAKLDVHSRAEAVAKASRTGLITP